MLFPRHLTLTISVLAVLALALPAFAQGQGPERRPEVPASAVPVPPAPPVTPVAPERPETPDTPDTPNRPVRPVTPERPDTPDTPSMVRPPVAGCFEFLPPNGSEMPGESAFAACVLENLSDVPGTTHEAAIVALVGEGIASGFSDGTFRPGEDISRAQMATMLDAALDLDPSVSGELPSDVDPNSVHAAAIAAITEAGISHGRVDGSFGPSEPVSRGHLAAFLVNAGLVDELPEGVAVETPEDVRGSVHEHAITLLIGNGIAGGFDDGTFRPAASVSRGQSATMIMGTLGSPLIEVDTPS